ncbi:unnamed protein product, partial [Ilex paraguariensis]
TFPQPYWIIPSIHESLPLPFPGYHRISQAIPSSVVDHLADSPEFTKGETCSRFLYCARSCTHNDGPFIDKSFYGNLDSLCLNGLKALGVQTDTEDVCALIFKFLTSHNQSVRVMRIYRFLQKFNWTRKLGNDLIYQLWIPDHIGGGKWVSSWDCVLHDKDNLFGHCLHALDKYYGTRLLNFLSKLYVVAEFPCLDRYIDLWDSWVGGNHELSAIKLNSFWKYISENWNSSTEESLKTRLTMLPAMEMSGKLRVVKNEELFIPDDLLLKMAFSKVSEKPLFVWFPQNGLSAFSRLYEIYRSLGIRKISEVVEFSVNCKFEKLESEESLIGRPLIKVVLSFLSNPLIIMPVVERHRRAKSLLDISLFGTEEPMIVSYSLVLPSPKKRLQVEVRKKVLWDNKSQRLLLHKPSWKEGHKDIEFITNFARAISEAVLPNSTTDLVDSLCKIIKMSFAFGFKEDEIDSLLVTQNLELSADDERFLDCAFPPFKSSLVSIELLLSRLESPCTPETPFNEELRTPEKKPRLN